MLCGFCCFISQTRARRACIVTSAAAPALSSISGLLSRKIMSPAEQWNAGSVLRASAFSPMTALNKLLKRPSRAAAGIWRATETASWSSESTTCIQREKFDDTGAERWSITFHFQPATKEGSFWWERGMVYQGCLAWGFIFVEVFLPVGIFWCSIFFPWTSGRYCTAQGLYQGL